MTRLDVMETVRHAMQKYREGARRLAVWLLLGPLLAGPGGGPVAEAWSQWTYIPLVALEKVDMQPSLPLRAAFYYPWFPESWKQLGIYPYTNYSPSLGFYDSSNQSVLQQHIAAMEYGGIGAGILSWWGQGSATDRRVPGILATTASGAFRWTIYYEPESLGNPSVTSLTYDLTYLRDTYGSDPSYLRINSRFVVFVYADAADGCAMVDRWKQANVGIDAYLVLKVFAGYAQCASQPDGWHQYGPAVAADRQGSYSYTISPGFHKVNEAARLARDPVRWRQNIRDMVASGARFQLITTFNEWGEGTSVESAAEWASPSGYGVYLDALHNNGAEPQPVTATATPGNTGWLSPSANAAQSGGDGNGYQVSAGNAYVDDGLFAVDTNSGNSSSSSCTNSAKDKHSFYTYNITVPSGTVIRGIEVRLDARADSSKNSPKICAQMSWNGGTTWTSDKSTPTLTTAEATYLLGGAANTWGRAWTASELGNRTYRLRVINVADSTARDFSLDWVAVRVTYQ